MTGTLCAGCCCLVFKFARSLAQGRQEKPSNPVGAALYNVSAKYGRFIPGGPAAGQHVGGIATGVPAAHVSKPPGDQAGFGYDGATPTYDQGQGSSAPIGAVQYGDASSKPDTLPGNYSGNTGFQCGAGPPSSQPQDSSPYEAVRYGQTAPSPPNMPPGNYGGNTGFQYGGGPPSSQPQDSTPYGAAPYGQTAPTPHGNASPYGNAHGPPQEDAAFV